MSQENVEVVRRVMAATKEAFATDDFAAAFRAGVRESNFFDHGEALEAAGLSE